MTKHEQDQQIADLVRRKHAAKREIACLEAKLKPVQRGVEALNIVVHAQAWGRIRHEGNRILVAADEERRDERYPISMDDLSLGDIADMAQRILHLTQQIVEDEQSLLRCLGDAED